jgi:hypothetical protein
MSLKANPFVAGTVNIYICYMNRALLYLIYAVALPIETWGFAETVGSLPGEHGGEFIATFIGLIVGQVIFAAWLFKFNRVVAAVLGFIIGLITVIISYHLAYDIIGATTLDYNTNDMDSMVVYSPWLANFAKTIFNAPHEEWKIVAIVFFFLTAMVSITFMEMVVRVKRKRA